jgi:uncharacterized protein (TIGR03067 family)
MKRLGWLAVFLTAGWLGAGEAGDKAVQAELKKLQGTWTYTASELAGKPVPEEFIKGGTLTIKGNKYTARLMGMVVDEGTIKIDPTKTPRTIDKISSKLKDFKMYGIYRLSGKELRVCENGEKRPTAFDSKAGALTGLHTLKRKD